MHLALLRDDDIVKDTWLLDNVTVLMTALKWEKQIRTIEIAVAEVTRDDKFHGATMGSTKHMSVAGDDV
jgi:hypothetical protein